MSEANAPFNRPDHPESTHSSDANLPDAFTNPFGEGPEVDAEADLSGQSMQFDTDEGGNQVRPLSRSRSPQAEPDRLTDQSAASPAHSVTITPGADNWLNPSEPTNLADLISLIQELNQCNSILLDRVSQLEEALERSQNALKAEVKRSHDYAFADYNPGLTTAQDLAAAQEQAIDLYNQLEVVHQTSQRQQILIETLTGQLETSQERVAQLERESALVQQRYNEQTQQLAQTESNCRDLQARLHRQQRYTMQFKVALEKSLDVSTPRFESVANVLSISNLSESSFLPKSQHIEPWTSPADISPARFPWMKLSPEPLQDESFAPETASQSAAKPEMPFSSADLPIVKARRSKLASVKLPGFPTANAEVPPAVNPAVSQNAPDLSAIPDEKLMQKLDSMVQPLADLLAEAVLTEVNSGSAPGTAAAGMESMVEPVASANYPVADYPVADYPVAEPIAPPADADDLLNSVMADAEDALWQDLARLIDVSTEDVVKASLSGDLSAFESIDFEALQATQATPSVEPAKGASRQSASRFQGAAAAPVASTPSPQSVEFPAVAEDEPIADNSESAGSAAPNPPSVFGTTPGWPAPLIYPTQPAKKRRSLAAVDLPSFLQQQPGPLPT